MSAFPMFHRAEKNACREGGQSQQNNVVSRPNFETKAGGFNDFGVEKLLAPKKNRVGGGKDPKFHQQMFEFVFVENHLEI